jgi:hypothetical protein
MSLHLPHQSEPPMTNHVYYIRIVVEIEPGQDPAKMASAIVEIHHTSPKIVQTLRFSRQLLIDRIKVGDLFEYNKIPLNIITVDGQPYIRTDQEQIASDHVR